MSGNSRKDTNGQYAEIKTLKKSLDLLEFFSLEHPQWSISELSKASGLYKSNVYNILYTLSLCGYSIDNGEHDTSVRCVAVPIYDRNGNPYGAMSASGQKHRMTDQNIQKYIELLNRSADQLRYYL